MKKKRVYIVIHVGPLGTEATLALRARKSRAMADRRTRRNRSRADQRPRAIDDAS